MLTEEEKEYYQKTIKAYKSLSKISWSYLVIPGLILLYYCVIKKPLDNIGTIIFWTAICVLSYTRAVFFDFKADILNDIVNKPGFGEKVEVVSIRKVPLLMFKDLIDWVKHHWLLSSIFCFLMVLLIVEWLKWGLM